MKTNAANLSTILGNDQLGFFTLIELNWNNQYYFTDYGQTLTFDGNNYLTNTPVVDISIPKYTTTIDRELFSMTLSGLDEDMVDEAETGIISLGVKASMIFTVAGVPQLGNNDVLNFYTGKVFSSKVVLTNEEKLIEVECTAPLNDLDSKGTLYTTKDGIKTLDATDTCFNSVTKGSEEINLKWGKI